MSVPVSIEGLRAQLASFGPTGYLVTVGADGRPHTVSVATEWEGDHLVMAGGNKTVANAVDRPLVSLLWAPVDPGGYSLIIDGTATAGPGRVSVRPTRAVLHRTASPPGSSDCVSVYP